MSRQYRVLVTGIGALIGQGIAEGLRQGGRSWVLGLDRRVSLFGNELCDEMILKPHIDEASADYLEFWKNTVLTHRIDLIMPGISVDMAFLNANRKFFEDLGITLALNAPNLIVLTEDKSAFETDYAKLGLPVIPSVRFGTWQDACAALGPPPLLLKPSVGEGSVGIVRMHDKIDFDYWTQKTSGDFLIQKIIATDEDEFTVGTFGFGDGTYNGPLIFRRKLTRAGNTGEAETVLHPVISQNTDRIMQHYKPIGPTNLQFRVDHDAAYLLEINPRFSSSCSMRTGFGFNEADMCIDFYLNNTRPAQPELRQGFAQRHNADRIKYAGTDL